jgi:tRNA threonylcarbamoyladenosine biosynthesis protein TsaE
VPADQYDYRAQDEEGTRQLAQRLVAVLPSRLTIGLIGTLGAGKTRLVQAIAAAVGIDPQSVTSPTFVLCQHHHGRQTIFHMDAYRLADIDEFIELGADEYFDSDGWTLVEWSDRVAAAMPPDRIDIAIEVTGEHQRQFHLVAHGEAARAALGRLAELEHS